MSTGFELYIKSGKKALEKLGNYREIAKEVKRMVREAWRDARVYVFGSVIEGRYTAGSDIDILVVVDGVGSEEAIRMKAKIYKSIDAPIQLHVASSSELENWYSRFIERIEEVN